MTVGDIRVKRFFCFFFTSLTGFAVLRIKADLLLFHSSFGRVYHCDDLQKLFFSRQRCRERITILLIKHVMFR